MFIAITTPQNPLRLENTLRPYKRGEQPFTPEAAQQILQSTNHKKNIFDTLQLIAALPLTEQAAFKEIILSIFDHREQPNDTIILGKKLAYANGVRDELKTLITQAKKYSYDEDCIFYHSGMNQKSYICVQTEPDLSKYPEEASVICTGKNITFIGGNPTIKDLKFTEGASVDLALCVLPQNIDFSMCRDVSEFVANYNNVKTITFKNQQQMEKNSLEIPSDWQGKIIFTEEKTLENELPPIINRGTSR